MEGSSCLACSVPEERADATYPVLTPYYRELGDNDLIQCSEAPRLNYSPYQLFCLQGKVNLYLYRRSPTYQALFVSYPLKGAMRLTIEVYSGERFVPLSTEEGQELQSYVDRVTTEDEQYCLLYSALPPLSREGVTLPRAWLLSMLPYLSLPDRYRPYLDGDALYIILSPRVDYESEWALLHNALVDRLFLLYKQGTVVCHPYLDRDIIERWGLSPILPGSNGQGLEEESQPYRPLWRDDRFASNLLLFIQQRLAGSTTITIPIGREGGAVRRHYTARLLQAAGREFWFDMQGVTIVALSYPESQSAAHAVQRALSLAQGLVVSLLSVPSLAAGEEKGKEVTALTPSSDAVTYRAEGGWTLSTLLPQHLPSMGLVSFLHGGGS